MFKIIFLILIIIFSSALIIPQINRDKKNEDQDNLSTIVPPRSEETDETLNDNQSLLAPEEELITNFFGLINNRQIPEAISLMSPQAVPDDSTKQAWGVHFNQIKSVNILNLEAISEDAWTDISKIYQVTLEIYVDEKAANAPIPYYGWSDNPNIRFITVWKSNDGKWYIDQIGTGP
jgi:hypothetical protein